VAAAAQVGERVIARYDFRWRDGVVKVYGYRLDISSIGSSEFKEDRVQ